ncbi:MAG: hypothetical protein LIO92_07625 [Clostridiales bacterium]|nr:hypothetical protein [Clostridiales bacterium]
MNMISGNTARKLMPERRPYIFAVNEKTGELILKQERSPFLGELPYVTVMAVAVIFTVISCFNFINLCTRTQCHVQAISGLESEYYRMSEQNNLLEKDLREVVDLNSIYEAAAELGMVRANRDNVLVYERRDSEYIYQTDNIPGIR